MVLIKINLKYSNLLVKKVNKHTHHSWILKDGVDYGKQ